MEISSHMNPSGLLVKTSIAKSNPLCANCILIWDDTGSNISDPVADEDPGYFADPDPVQDPSIVILTFIKVLCMDIV